VGRGDGEPRWGFKGNGEWTSAAFSPDGNRVFISMEDQKAKLLDARTGKPLVEFTGFDDNRGFGFSPDGTRIVAGGQRVKVWDAEKGGPPLLDLRGLMDAAGCTTFSPDGTRILIGHFDGTAKVLDARTGAPLLTLKGHPARGCRV
jgi:WD40 repeat protein